MQALRFFGVGAAHELVSHVAPLLIEPCNCPLQRGNFFLPVAALLIARLSIVWRRFFSGFLAACQTGLRGDVRF